MAKDLCESPFSKANYYNRLDGVILRKCSLVNFVRCFN